MSAKAWQWSLWLSETPWPQVSPLLLIRVWAPATVGLPGWWSVFQQEALSLLEKWPCRVSVGGSVPTLLGDEAAMDGVESWSFQRKEVSVLFVSGPSDGCSAPHTRGCAGRWREQALVGVRCPHLSVYSLWLPKLPLGCSYYLWISKESLSRFWQRQNFFSL